MVFSACPALASITVDEGNTVYKSEGNCLIEIDSNVLIAGCYTSVIPDYVTSIGDYAFLYIESLSAITIPSSVASIGDEAFSNCTSLSTITIPSSVTSIGDMAFLNCTSLSTVTISTSITSISSYAFAGCESLNNITIPTSVTSIDDAAFLGCISLSSITIPTSVTSIGYMVFSACPALASITVDEGNTVYKSEDNCLIEISSNVLMAGCYTSVIPDYVTSIGDYAFYGCTSLSTITIPNSITSIGYSAFSGCTSLSSITIPNGVTSIGHKAFSDCTNLTIYAQTSPNHYEWDFGWNYSIRPVIWGCELSSEGYVISFEKTNTSISNPSENPISAPDRKGYIFAGWYDNASFEGTPTSASNIESTPNKKYYAKWIK